MTVHICPTCSRPWNAHTYTDMAGPCGEPAEVLARPGQVVTLRDRPRRLGPTEYLLRCSRCEAPTIVLAEADPGNGVLCEGCLFSRNEPLTA